MLETALVSIQRPTPTIKRDIKHQLLCAAGKYPYLTAEQAVKICGFSPKSINHIREHYKRLAETGYIVRFDKVRQLGIPIAHVLSARGGHYVASCDAEVKLTLQPSELKAKSPYFILHTQSVNEVLLDRKSTRLNSSHANISYAVFCLKKKKT